MTPEEIFNQRVWKILQDIKEESFAPNEDGTFFYDTTTIVIVAGKNSPTQERKIAIVHKLAREEKAVEIVEEIPPDWRGTRNGFYLKLIQPQFDEVYDKYRKTCDLTNYLNDYQERMLKGDNLPEFSQVELIDNKEKTTPATPVKHKGQMFETGSGGGYYNRSHPIRPMKKQSASEIVDEFSPENYPFVLMVLKQIASLTEFSANNKVSYQLQSPHGQLLIQERSLLNKLQSKGLFRNLGEDGILGIATLRDIDIGLIKQVVAEIESKSSGVISKDEFEEIKAKNRYEKLIEEIRKPSQPPLEERYKRILGQIKSQKPSPAGSAQNTVISLKDKEIKYDDKEARILIGDTVCQLPPYKNEHYLCGVMFKKKINQPVDWSVVYEKMSGDYEKHYGKTPKTREHWRAVYDTMIRINNRIKKEIHTTDDLFSWQELTIKRNF